MERVNVNQLLGREEKAEQVKSLLLDFQKNKTDISRKRGIYLHGSPGSGKTTFVKKVICDMGFDPIVYDSSDARNKSVIDSLKNDNISDKSVLTTFSKETQKQIVIVMDEIDGMNTGDKGGINSLIKLVRPKKTKRQKLEHTSMNPIICIGNYHVDKKIKELIKVCHTVDLGMPSKSNMELLVAKLMPNIDNAEVRYIIEFIGNDLRKLKTILDMYSNSDHCSLPKFCACMHQLQTQSGDAKQIVKKIFSHKFTLNEHNSVMSETDRTIVGLVYHENMIDFMDGDFIDLYLVLLENFCFADYIDRVTFQKQIWQFNEMTSLIKTFYNNEILHNSPYMTNSTKEPRFTRVLTKYSTEYNNSLFVQNLCQKLNMDKKDMFAYFRGAPDYKEMEQYDITKLDINRIEKFFNRSRDDEFHVWEFNDEQQEVDNECDS